MKRFTNAYTASFKVKIKTCRATFGLLIVNFLLKLTKTHAQPLPVNPASLYLVSNHIEIFLSGY